MTFNRFFVLAFLTGACLFNGASFPDDFPVLKGPYLGQHPPGSTATVFAPGIISSGVAEGSSCFSRDGRLFLFVRGGSDAPGIYFMQQVNGIWQKPSLAPFSAGRYDWDFMMAPDDITLFVSSGRPLEPGGAPSRDYHIWRVRRNGTDWTEAQRLPQPVNTGQHDSYPCAAANGDLYFFSNRSGGYGQEDIYRARKQGDRYPAVENLGPTLNSTYHEVDPYIAPDQSYLIFCSDKPGGFGGDDFYVTFKREDGSWSEPRNLGPAVNSAFQEYIPAITPDGKYFFFTSNKSGNREIYWIDATVIYRLGPDRLK